MVTVHFEDDGMEEEYKIVTTVRSDALNQMISIDSPMGKALLKHRVGERVLVKVNDKVSYYVTIRGIRKNDDDRKKLINSRFLQRIRWKGNEEHVVYLCSVWKKI